MTLLGGRRSLPETVLDSLAARKAIFTGNSAPPNGGEASGEAETGSLLRLRRL